jgi:hypothetical protein
VTEPLLPDQSADDTDVGWGDERDEAARDEDDVRRLEDDRPPHYDDR